MNVKDLLRHWESQPRPVRTARQYAVRLSVDDAARLHALAELYAGRTDEEFITELLTAALDELAEAMPYVAGDRIIGEDDHGDPIYEDAGLTPRFIALTRKHRRRLESELRGDGDPSG